MIASSSWDRAALAERDAAPVGLEAGTVAGVFVAPAAGEAMIALVEVQAVSGKGLVGDRYCTRTGSFSRRRVAGREVTDITLVEAEVIEMLRSRGVQIDPAGTRRNIVTRGVALNDLTGRRFCVGAVQLVGVNLCEPCASLFAPKSRRDALRGLAHKGGLRARVLSDGLIRTGDPIVSG
jgi:MOSC domain-containing protein YiiM